MKCENIGGPGQEPICRVAMLHRVQSGRGSSGRGNPKSGPVGDVAGGGRMCRLLSNIVEASKPERKS